MTCIATIEAVAQLPPGVDDYIEKARSDWKVPGITLTVVRDGRVLAAKGYGVRQLGKPDLVDGDTVYDIASLAKSFTAAAIATLVDERKMRWDDPVRRHLPAIEFPDAERTYGVTMRDLLAHRVGLETANTMSRFIDYGRPEMLRRVRFLAVREPLRSGMIYSNVMYLVAGEAAGSAAGTSWESLVRDRLLVPLGMRSSTAGVSHDRGPNFAAAHASIRGVQQPIRSFKHMSILPAGGVNSTANDMARWLLFHLGDGSWEGKRIISAEAMAEMHSPQVVIPTNAEFRKARMVDFFAAYGLGWQVMDYRGEPMLWHSGNADGMPSYMAILPEKKIGVFVGINTWAASVLHGSLAAYVLDALLGHPARDPSGELLQSHHRAVERETAGRADLEKSRIKETTPSRPLSAYAGTYVEPLYGDITVRLENDVLTLQLGQGQLADLEHWHYDTFRVRWRDPVYRESFSTLVTFSLGSNAQPRAMEMRVNRDDLRAIRR